MPPEARQVPIAAMQMSIGPWAFATPSDEDPTLIPIRMTARSGQPVHHWYWGAIYHDFAGMAHKESVPVDWCHDDDEVIGFLNQFDTSRNELDVSGALVRDPGNPRDRVRELAHKSSKGVPYEASIFFTDSVVEEVKAGATAMVNGQRINGPAYIFRKWSLRGVAVCPHGRDHNTASRFSEGDQINVTILSAKDDEAMTKEIEPEGDKQAEKPDVKTEPEADGKQAESQGKQPEQPRGFAEFVEHFGIDKDSDDYRQAAVWFAEGKSWDDAQTAYVAKLRADRDGAVEKLAAIRDDAGEQTPIGFGTPPGTEQSQKDAAKYRSVLGENLGRFAAGITFKK